MKRRSIGPSISFFAFQDIITAVVGIFILITLILVLELTQRVEAATSPPSANVEQITSTIESLKNETERLALEYAKRIKQQADATDINNFNRIAKTEELKAALQAATEQLATIEAQIAQTAERLQQEQKMESKLLRESEQLEDERDKIADLKQHLEEIVRIMNRLKSDSGLIYRDQTGDGRFLCILTLDASGIESKDAGSKSVRNFSAGNWFDSFEQWIQQTDIQSRHFLLLVRPTGARDFDRVRELLADRNCVYGFDVVGKHHNVQLGFEWETQP